MVACAALILALPQVALADKYVSEKLCREAQKKYAACLKEQGGKPNKWSGLSATDYCTERSEVQEKCTEKGDSSSGSKSGGKKGRSSSSSSSRTGVKPGSRASTATGGGMGSGAAALPYLFLGSGSKDSGAPSCEQRIEASGDGGLTDLSLIAGIPFFTMTFVSLLHLGIT